MNSRRKAEIRRLVVTGAIVGAVAGLITVLYSLVVSLALGQGFFTPLYAAASPFFGVNYAFTSLTKGFYVEIAPIVVALIGDIIGSAIFGVAFALIWRAAELPRTWAIPVGMLFGLVVMGFMAVIILPITGAGFTMDEEGWSYLVEHLLFGGLLGAWAGLAPLRIPLARRASPRVASG